MRRSTRLTRAFAVCAIVCAGAAAALAQFGGPRESVSRAGPNIPYDGRFTFVRPEIHDGARRLTGTAAGRRGATAIRSPNRTCMRIMNEVSYLEPARRGDQHADARRPGTLQVSDRLHRSKCDWWAMTDREAAALRDLHSEGRLRHRRRLQAAALSRRLRRRLRQRLESLRGAHEARAARVPVLRSRRLTPDLSLVLRRSTDLDIIPQAYIGGQPIFRGLFEDNDPSKRLQMIVDYNTDVSQFWEWSGTGLQAGRRHATKRTSSA